MGRDQLKSTLAFHFVDSHEWMANIDQRTYGQCFNRPIVPANHTNRPKLLQLSSLNQQPKTQLLSIVLHVYPSFISGTAHIYVSSLQKQNHFLMQSYALLKNTFWLFTSQNQGIFRLMIMIKKCCICFISAPCHATRPGSNLVFEILQQCALCFHYRLGSCRVGWFCLVADG